MALGGLSLALGCAPVPMTEERATRLCLEEAGLADGVGGTLGVGLGSSGATARAGITVTNRILDPRTREEFMADCVARRLAGRPAPATVGVTIGGSL